MSRVVSVIIALWVLCLMVTPVRVAADEKPLSEKQQIEALIKHVESLKGAVFIRNDREYDADDAARFLRGKWKANQADIKTAKDFIDKIASVSSTTGKTYKIRLKDGTEKKSGEYLLEVLRKLEK